MNDLESKFSQAIDMESLGFIRQLNKPAILSRKELRECHIYHSYHIDMHKLQGMRTWIVFPEVENLLNAVLGKYGFSQDLPPYTFSFQSYLKPDPQYFKVRDHVNLVNEESVEYVAKIAREYILSHYSPLWEKFSSLQVVNDEVISTLPQSELYPYLPSPYMAVKKLIIMKLCHNKHYDEYRDWVDQIYLQMIAKNPEENTHYFIFKDICNVLEGM